MGKGCSIAKVKSYLVVIGSMLITFCMGSGMII